MEGTKQSVKERLKDMMRDADGDTLQGSGKIVAVAILYEGGIATPPPKERLAAMLVDQYKNPGWIPPNLSVGGETVVVMRQLIRGEEISEGAGLDSAGSNAALASMLADELSDVAGCSAIVFSGNSPALGQTFFAVVAR